MPNMTGIYKDEDNQEYTSWDFFHPIFKNRVEPFQDKCHIDTIERKFLEATEMPYATAVTRPAYWRTQKKKKNGRVITVPHYKPNTSEDKSAHRDYDTYRFPFQLEYEGVHNFPDNRDDEWYNRLRQHFND